MRISDWSSDVCSSDLSEIVGSKLAHSSPTLIAACHVLHRLCMPRHSPNALTSHLRVHTTNDSPDDPKIDHMSLMMRMIVFILSQYSSCVDRHDQIGRAHVLTPVTNAHLVCRLLLEKKKI